MSSASLGVQTIGWPFTLNEVFSRTGRPLSFSNSFNSCHNRGLCSRATVWARAEPSTSSRRKRPQSVWVLLPRVEPALAEWAAFFAAGASKRAAAEAGLPAAASAHEADDLLRDAETFVSLAESTLGVPSGQTLLPLRTAG